MKKLENLLSEKPSYTFWSAERLALKTGLALSTVQRFKKSDTFKTIRDCYYTAIGR